MAGAGLDCPPHGSRSAVRRALRRLGAHQLACTALALPNGVTHQRAFCDVGRRVTVPRTNLPEQGSSSRITEGGTLVGGRERQAAAVRASLEQLSTTANSSSVVKKDSLVRAHPLTEALVTPVAP